MPTTVYILDEEKLDIIHTDSQEVDTQLFGFDHNYPMYSGSFPFLDLGFEGSPTLLLDRNLNRALELQPGLASLNHYFFDHRINIYQTDKPFTRLNYSQGRQEYLNIEATHAQQISKRLSFGINYRRLKNHNLYYSNLLNTDNVRLSNLFNTKFYIGYFSKARQYEMAAAYIWNRSINIETGGLTDSRFFNSLEGRAKLENNPVHLSSAFNSYAENHFKVMQYFRPGGIPDDTNLLYSLGRFKHQFSLKTEFGSQRIEYTDQNPDSAYYAQRITDLHDSIYFRQFSNELSYLIKNRSGYWRNSVRHQYVRIYQDSGISDLFNNIYAHSEAGITLKNTRLKALAKWGIYGYNSGDYDIKLEGQSQLAFCLFKLKALSQKVEPAYLWQSWKGKAMVWDKQLQKTSTHLMEAEIQWKNRLMQLSAAYSLQQSTNFTYFNELYFPEQYKDQLILNKFKLQYKIENQWMGLHLNGLYQHTKQHIILPLPEFSGSSAVFINMRFFNENLLSQLGLETFLYSSFNAPIYHPYTRQWHNTSANFNAYPLMRLFVNIKVQHFCFGVSVFNIQDGLMGQDFYSAPNYPMMPRLLRLNLRWDLFN